MNMEKKRSFKRNTMKTWGISYFMLFIMPLLFFIVFITVSIEVLRSEIAHYNQLAVMHVGSIFDSSFSQINSSAEDILLNNRFSNIFSSDPFSLPVYNLYQSAAELSRLGSQDVDGGTLFIYSPSRDFFIGGMKFGHIDDVSDLIEFNLGSPNTNVPDIFHKNLERMEIYDISYTYTSGNTVKRILITRPLSYVKSSPVGDYCIAQIVNLSTLLGANTEFDAYHNLMIFNRLDGNLAYAISPSVPGDVKLSTITANGIDKGNIIAIAPSDVSNFIYAIMIDRSEYFHPMRIMEIIAVVYFFFTLILGIFLVLRLVRKSWSELEDAMRQSGADTDLDAGDGVYSPFISSLSRLEKEKEGLSIMVSAQSRSLKMNMIDRLLSSADASIISENALKECGIEFSSDSFIVYLALDENEDVVNAFMDAGIHTYPFSSSYAMSLILNLVKGSDEAAAMEKISEIANEKRNNAASSDIVHGLEMIGQAYIDAINTIDYKKENSFSEFVACSDVTAISSKVQYSFPSDCAYNLQKYVKDGRSDDAVSLIRELFMTNQAAGVPPRHLRYLLLSISNRVLKMSLQLEGVYGSDVGIFSPPQILEARKSVESIRLELEGRVYRYVEKILSARNMLGNVNDETYMIYQKVLREISERYSQSMFNVSSLADDLGVTLAYLSKVFKRYHKMNISDYLAHYRVDGARKLLEEGVALSQVAEQCGFGSLRTFMRVFKKVEGVSPGQYRQFNMEEKT